MRMETCKTGASLRANTLLFARFTSKLLFWSAMSLAVGGGLCLELSLGQITPNPNICHLNKYDHCIHLS